MTSDTEDRQRNLSEADYRSRWMQYEQRKREWASRNPTATSSEFEAAVRRIMSDLGL